ncbi:hypothetical protein ACP4OV_002475 [Aristida adscensionis]
MTRRALLPSLCCARCLPSPPSPFPIIPGIPCAAPAARPTPPHLPPPPPKQGVPAARRRAMGKYMRKGKVSGEVAVMEVPGGALLGVRTRSRTLALQRAQRPPEKGEHEAAPEAGEYLELRSRRLEKPHKEAAAAAAAPRRGAGRKGSGVPAPAEEEVQVSFGENVLDFDAMEREHQRDNALQFD